MVVAALASCFGPVMLLWFITLPPVALHPNYAAARRAQGFISGGGTAFAGAHPLLSLLALGAIVLAITGAEALYADMGHFGRPAISAVWFAVVFPALALCYLGRRADAWRGSHQGNLVVQLFPWFGNCRRRCHYCGHL